MKQKRRCVYHKFVIVFLCLIYAFAGCKEKTEPFDEVTLLEEEPGEEEKADPSSGNEETAHEEANTAIVVYVCGEVLHPGVYELDTGARVVQAIQKAGGFTESADDEFWNQAELVSDGQKIYVPTKEEAADLAQTGKSQNSISGSEGKVNLNTASLQELMTLSGIGQSRAEAILKYREKNGGFKSIEEIQKVEGIKEGVFEKIKDDIIVD